MEPNDQEYTVCFLYAQLRAEIVRCLTDYTKTERGSLAELKDRFSPSLSEEEKRRIKNVKQLIKAVEEKGVIGPRNVKYIKLLAEKIGLKELVDEIEEFENDCSGIVQRALNAAAKAPAVIWEVFKGGVKTSAVQLKAMLSCREVKATVLVATLLGVYGMNPETVQNLQPFLDLRARLLALFPGSVVFVLKISSIASIKRLWKSYKDGSLRENVKRALNEMKELNQLSKGEEIDVEVTIDEEEYHKVFWNLILSEVKANDAKESNEAQPSLISRRHSIGCEQDVSRLAVSSNLPGVSQLHIRPWRHVGELDKVLNNFKSIKAKIEASENTAIELKEVVSMVEQEEKRLSEIRQELSELNIVIDATGFEKVKVEEKAGLTVMHDKVEGIDSGASTSLQAEKDKKDDTNMADGGHGSSSKNIGLRAKKKILGKMASKSVAKAFVDDATGDLLDNLYRIAKLNGATKKEAEKLIKNLLKIVGKIRLLYRDGQFSKEEIDLADRLKKKFRSTAMTFISFYEKDSSFDCEFLINSLDECKGLLHQLIQRHLTQKSHSRIDHVFDYFGNGDLLKGVFKPTGPYQEIVKNMVDELKELKIIEKDSL